MKTDIKPGDRVRCIRGHEPVLTKGRDYTVGAVLCWVCLRTTGHTLSLVSSENDGGELGGIGGWFKPTTEKAYSVTFNKPQVILIEQGIGPQFMSNLMLAFDYIFGIYSRCTPCQPFG